MVSKFALAVNTSTTNILSTQCLIVGGFVRDSLLGISPKDIDIEVFGIQQAELDKIIRKLFSKFDIQQSKKFGTWAVNTKNGELNISLPRNETKIGKGYFGFKIELDPALSINQAATRRDFTVNAIYMNPLTNQIIDPYNGQKDLKTKTLRAVNMASFAEDPLRLYRAIQFVARFNLKVEPKTLKLLKIMAKSDEIKTLSEKRVKAIIQKMFSSKANPKLGLNLAKMLGIVLPNSK